MSNHLWVRLLAGAALLSLAACGDADGDDVSGKPKPDPTPQSQFGATFESAFNVDCNADPIDPQPGDLPPVSCETDPIDF